MHIWAGHMFLIPLFVLWESVPRCATQWSQCSQWSQWRLSKIHRTVNNTKGWKCSVTSLPFSNFHAGVFSAKNLAGMKPAPSLHDRNMAAYSRRTGKDGRMIYKHFKRRSCGWKSPIECLVSCLSGCLCVGQSKVLSRAVGITALNILLEKRVSRHTFAELCLIFEATQLRKMNTSKGAVSQQVQKTMANAGRMTAGQPARLHPGLQVAMCPRD